MTLSTVAIIILAESLAGALLVIMLLIKRGAANKDKVLEQKALITNLQAELKRAQALTESATNDDKPDLASTPKEDIEPLPEPERPPPPLEPFEPEKTYRDMLEEQLEATVAYYEGLEGSGEIALDLDPDSPADRRIAALRHAILIAEKEAQPYEGGSSANWEFLVMRYTQILDFQHDYSAPPEPPQGDFEMDTSIGPTKEEVVVEGSESTTSNNINDEVEKLREELDSARKRISNLEKFKSLYFELEAKWGKTQEEAQVHYDKLKVLAADSDDITNLVDSYHASYQSMNNIIVNRTEGDEVSLNNEQTLSEMRRLRNMASEQHHVIEDLQNQLKQVHSNDEQANIIECMKEEFKKQARFMEESDTCIKLMEEELNSAQVELENQRDKIRCLSLLQTKVDELEYADTKNMHALQTLKQENARLLKQVKSRPPEAQTNDNTGNTSSENSAAPADAIKALNELEKRYTDLEERYLDLKLQG